MYIKRLDLKWNQHSQGADKKNASKDREIKIIPQKTQIV